MSDRDYYEILGLTPGADAAMVDQSYWHLARKYQALAATNEHAGYMLDELNEAYGVLGNPRLREQYDAFRDDVLIRKGLLKPVASKSQRPRRRRKSSDKQREARPAASVKLPALPQGPARWYTLAGALVLVGLGAAYAGVGASIVVLTLAAGLGVALVQVARTRLATASLSMPDVSLPDVRLPEVRRPRVELPETKRPRAELPELRLPSVMADASGRADEPLGADELRTSTAAMIARWRQSIGLRGEAAASDPERSPSLLLRDIVSTERASQDEDEPLTAALNILSRSRRRPIAPRD